MFKLTLRHGDQKMKVVISDHEFDSRDLIIFRDYRIAGGVSRGDLYDFMGYRNFDFAMPISAHFAPEGPGIWSYDDKPLFGGPVYDADVLRAFRSIVKEAITVRQQIINRLRAEEAKDFSADELTRVFSGCTLAPRLICYAILLSCDGDLSLEDLQ